MNDGETADATLEILKCYKPVYNTKADVYLLWGGRDRGASHYTAQQLILDCLQDDYFRCILVRKTYESIRDSQYATIKDIVEDAGMAHLFTFLKSPLEIHCNHNGNKFLARGCDNPIKIKSVRNPNVVHIEEADQITEEDYIIIHTTLRHETARVREWMTFNSDFPGDYEDHFLWNYYLKNVPNVYDSGLYETEIEVPIDKAGGDKRTEIVKFYSAHGTYHQNPHCPPKRRATYEGLRLQNEYYYNVYARGILGKKENDNPWAWALNRDKHYREEKFEPNPNYNLELSFDFNHDPCVVVVGQHEQHLPRYSVIGYHRASSGNESALKQLCDRIKTTYPHHFRTKQMVVTGDATGTQRDPSRPSNVNRYTDICGYLGIGLGVVKNEKANLPHKSSRDLCNDVLHQIPEGGYVFWGGRGCEMLLSEIESTYPDDKESLNKAKKELGLHGLDAWRYLNQLWFAHGLKGAEFRQYQREIDAIVSRLKTRNKLSVVGNV